MLLFSAYVIQVCRAMESCYRIKDLNYWHIAFLLLAGLTLSRLFPLLYRKIAVKPFYYLITAAALSAFVLYNRESVQYLWDSYIVSNYHKINDAIYHSSETEFRMFLPFLAILIPSAAAASDAFRMKGHPEALIFIMSFFMFTFWNNMLDHLISDFIPLFIFITLVYYCYGRYDLLVKISKHNNSMVSVRLRSIILNAVVVSSIVIVLSSFAAYLFGTESIAQKKNSTFLRNKSMIAVSLDSSYEVANSGFGSGGGRLGGPVALSRNVALRVIAHRPAYLKGAVSDFYDGTRWTRSPGEYRIKGNEPLTVANRDLIYRMTGSHNKRLKTEKMTIYTVGLETSTLFVPANLTGLTIGSGRIIYDKNRNFMHMGKHAVIEPYSLKHYVSSTGIEEFQNITGTPYSFSYENGWELDERYHPYLQLPRTITPRTRELAARLLQGCATTEEKVERIADYLKTSFPYSLQVSDIPENHDFVDYFLFEEKKGYCTYFATTAAVFFRMAGIPARYVEGFKMNDEKDDSGAYLVRNSSAHAWVEILVSPESDLWCIVDCVPAGTIDYNEAEPGQYWDRFDSDFFRRGSYDTGNITQETNSNEGILDYSAILPLLIYPLMLLPAALILFMIAYLLYKLIIYRRKVRMLIAAEGIVPIYSHWVKRLSSMGIIFPQGSCELEYADTIGNSELSNLLKAIIRKCYDEHFGGNMNTSIPEKVYYNRKIEKHLRKAQGFIRYWYHRIRN